MPLSSELSFFLSEFIHFVLQSERFMGDLWAKLKSDDVTHTEGTKITDQKHTLLLFQANMHLF